MRIVGEHGYINTNGKQHYGGKIWSDPSINIFLTTGDVLVLVWIGICNLLRRIFWGNYK